MTWIQKIFSKKDKILALSPMADMTDSPFCQIVRKIGGADIVFREMVSSEAVVRHNEKTLGMTDFAESERPIVQQIFGADPATMARAAATVMEHAAPEGIDINMGCPVYKITSNFNGCALMKEPERAAKIIKEIRYAIGDSVPISVKIRLGWSNPDDFKKFIPVIEEAGADLITIHGRTKAQGYSGVSDWKRIRQAKEIARVPVLANGDIHEPHQVTEVLIQTGADGVLIARGALGNPWFFKLCENYSARGGCAFGAEKYENTNYELFCHPERSGHSERSRDISSISLDERIRVVLEHVRLHVVHYGEKSMVTFRKHLAWYFKANKVRADAPGLKNLRTQLVRINTIEELEEILLNFKNSIKEFLYVGVRR